MRKLFAPIFILCLMITCALGEGVLPEPFMGYFEAASYIRPEVGVKAEVLKTIPRETAVLLTPVNDKYAYVEYEGASGYVYYLSAKDMPKETDVTPYIVYADGNKYLQSAPLSGAKRLNTLPPQTPITVVSELLSYYKVSVDDNFYYIFRRDAKRLTEDEAIAPREMYLTQAITALSLPLKNASPAFSLDAYAVYTVEYENNGYYRVNENGQSGYIPKSAATLFKKDASLLRIANIASGTKLYAYPSDAFCTDETIAARALYFLEGENDGFYRLKGAEHYVRAEDVTVYLLQAPLKSPLIALTDTPLTYAPQEDAAHTGATLTAGRLYANGYAAGSYCLLNVGDTWGFVHKDALSRLTASERMNNTAAITAADTVLYSAQGDMQDIPAGTKLFLQSRSDAFYLCQLKDAQGYVMAKDVTLISADIPIDSYTLPAPRDIILFDVPDKALAAKTAVILKGEPVRVTAVNRCYLLVSCGDKAGYATQDGLLTDETMGIPSSEDIPTYHIMLDKQSYMLYVLAVNENGDATPVMSAMVALGKRTTPTPSGTFTLGYKERWHRFTHSYTPHTTFYVGARYIHGLPCEQKDERTVMDALAHNAGQAVTGGCVRSPFDIARFIYLNCPAYQTTMTVVNGGYTIPHDNAPAQIGEQPTEE